MTGTSSLLTKTEHHMIMCRKFFLDIQDPITGLLPSSLDKGGPAIPPESNYAWVRDNVYAALCIWGLCIAYLKMSDMYEVAHVMYELEKSATKIMRSLLLCMMKQSAKVELFKHDPKVGNSLHAKYNLKTCETVLNDNEWGHLQIDATSLYLLVLAQMISSGLHIIYTLDEVKFVQNLIYYIENAYMIADYGIFERGDKTNHGLPELNASSIGLAKAALESLSEFNLFGVEGGPNSIIHVQVDCIYKCHAVIESMLPNESNSKEVAASLLTIVGFPAFSITDEKLVTNTKETIIRKLEGAYGLCRFLRDGYKTAVEDPTRLHYELSELKIFEKIESEWPLYFIYLMIDAIFQGNKNLATDYLNKIKKIAIYSSDHIEMIPELYYVPHDRIQAEYARPKSQHRTASPRVPHLWSQSLYILANLLYEDILFPGDIDPLNRRFTRSSKPELVTQILLVSQDNETYDLLLKNNIQSHKLIDEKCLSVFPAHFLNEIYEDLGYCKKFNLSGRPTRDIGIASTSILYRTKDRFYAFTPQFLDTSHFYFTFDHELIEDNFRNELNHIKRYWSLDGRPTVILALNHDLLENSMDSSIAKFILKIKTGHFYGMRIQLGTLLDFVSTSCITQWDFMSTDKINQKLDKMCLIIQKRPQIFSTIFKYSTAKLSVNTSQKEGDVLIDRAKFNQTSRISSQSSTSRDSNIDSIDFSIKSCDESFANISKISDTSILIEILEASDNIYEQALSLFRIYQLKSPSYEIILKNGNSIGSVNTLLRDLYNIAGIHKLWLLLRHTAGYLQKHADGLSQASTSFIIRQKQFTVGYPTYEENVISNVLTSEEVKKLIYSSYHEDIAGAVLTQEIMIYLSLFIITEPKLFQHMIRLRFGLIIQVVASEFARETNISPSKVSDVFLNTSPFFVKMLIYHVFSGKEFKIKNNEGQYSIQSCHSRISRIKYSASENVPSDSLEETSDGDGTPLYQQNLGFWYRRRFLDGSLNRIPDTFFSDVWRILNNFKGISLSGYILKHSVVEEMTPNEMKFALYVESALNSIYDPEYRQIIIETLMLLGQLISVMRLNQDASKSILQMHLIIDHANDLFLKDQFRVSGDAMSCCAGVGKDKRKCCDLHGLCTYFYDSAPSGEHGTLNYIARAVFELFLPT